MRKAILACTLVFSITVAYAQSAARPCSDLIGATVIGHTNATMTVEMLNGQQCVISSSLTVEVLAVGTKVPLENPSFEEPLRTDGGWSDFKPGWWPIAGYPYSWIVNPTSGTNPAPIPDGEQLLRVDWEGSAIQKTSHQITANTTYVLTVYVGHRTNWEYHHFVPIHISIISHQQPQGGNRLDDITILAKSEDFSPAPETWEKLQLSYTVGPSGPNIGKYIGVKIVNYGPELGGFAEVDNLTLTIVETTK